jgi:hypothetical protein
MSSTAALDDLLVRLSVMQRAQAATTEALRLQAVANAELSRSLAAILQSSPGAATAEGTPTTESPTRAVLARRNEELEAMIENERDLARGACALHRSVTEGQDSEIARLEAESKRLWRIINSTDAPGEGRHLGQYNAALASLDEHLSHYEGQEDAAAHELEMQQWPNNYGRD